MIKRAGLGRREAEQGRQFGAADVGAAAKGRRLATRARRYTLETRHADRVHALQRQRRRCVYSRSGKSIDRWADILFFLAGFFDERCSPLCGPPIVYLPGETTTSQQGKSNMYLIPLAVALLLGVTPPESCEVAGIYNALQTPPGTLAVTTAGE